MTGNHEAQAALVRAAETAGHAPSIHNTQPWRWHAHPDALDLYADRTRQLPVTDPVGRLLAVSCGAALHHAVVSLAAQGWATKVDLLPDGDVDHLARHHPAGPEPVTPDAVRLSQTISCRHTDRRPVADTQGCDPGSDRPITPPPPWQRAPACTVLGRGQVLEVAGAAGHAQHAEDSPTTAGGRRWPTGRAGYAPRAWVCRPTPSPPNAPRPPSRPETSAKPGTLPVGHRPRPAAAYAILYGDKDDPPSWLRAGRRSARLWLTATEHGRDRWCRSARRRGGPDATSSPTAGARRATRIWSCAWASRTPTGPAPRTPPACRRSRPSPSTTP